MDFNSIDQYINKLPFNNLYTVLSNDDKESIVFSALETLKDEYRESLLTDRIVAIQVLYMIEGEDEDLSKYKRQGVTEMTIKNLSFTFKDSYDISPQVQKILSKGRLVGRLV